MSTGEYQSISDAITELKNDFKEFRKDFDNYRLDIADNYAKKQDNDDAHKSIIGWVIGIYVLVFGAVGSLYAYISNFVRK